MAEVADEATHVWSHKARIALFLSAMRHFRDALRKRGLRVDYRELNDPENGGDFTSEFEAAVKRLRPERIVMVEAGEWRVRQAFEEASNRLGSRLEIRTDRHFR